MPNNIAEESAVGDELGVSDETALSLAVLAGSDTVSEVATAEVEVTLLSIEVVVELRTGDDEVPVVVLLFASCGFRWKAKHFSMAGSEQFN